MRVSTAGALWRLAIIGLVCLTAGFGMIAVFGQLRFGPGISYRAEFTDVSGLAGGNFVRVAGVEVGKVKNISIKNNTIAIVDFELEQPLVLTDSTKAVVRYQNLTGERYLALTQGSGGLTRLAPGATIPVDRTAPALDIDALIGGLKPLFQALNPDQVNALSNQLVGALQGEGPTIDSFLQEAATLTGVLAEHDRVIGQVIGNLDTVLSSVGDHSKQLDSAVTALSDLVGELSDHRLDISNSLSHLDATSAVLADLLSRARAPLSTMVGETDRTTSLVLKDHDYFNQFLDGILPAYKTLARQGLYGDFLNIYICELVLKLNGKGGQPVFVRVANQVSGRCAPR